MLGASNSYSITLPSKACFLHRDYLTLYTAALPRQIYDHVNEHFECEDIAMSYFVSVLTGGRPQLMTDLWVAQGSTIELFSYGSGISLKEKHLSLRNVCGNDFAEYLGLKEVADDDGDSGGEDDIMGAVGRRYTPLKMGTLNQGSFFGY